VMHVALQELALTASVERDTRPRAGHFDAPDDDAGPATDGNADATRTEILQGQSSITT